MSRNNVRGPTSALTEFLREQGITARAVVHGSPRRRGRAANAQEDGTNAQAGPSNAGDMEVNEEVGAENEGGTEGTSSPKKTRRRGYASDDLDEMEEESKKPAVKKRKLGKVALDKLKAKEKAKAKKGKKEGGGSDDEDYEDSDDDEYTALSKGGFTRAGKGSVLPPAGSFENCATCEKKFTVTRYTMAANPGPGFLCHNCAKASGADPFKKPASPRKRKDPAGKRKLVSFEETERVRSLASMCIEVIGKYIDDVEALGNIGSFNMNEIARVMAKNRSLTSENSQLLYDVKNTTLTLYDVTNLNPDALCTLASLNPNLESLRLDFCGRVDDVALLHWSSHLTSLTRIELLGPFLVRVPGWISFITQKGSQLRGFLITQSPRFDLECVETLAKHAPNLTDLRLSEIGKLSDEWLPALGTLSNLTSLELSKPTHSLHDEALVEFLKSVGPNLMHLDLSGNEDLTDVTLLDGLLPHVTRLTSLVLSNVPLVTDQGFAEFFNSWSANPPLERLDLCRNHLPSSSALAAVLDHSGRLLEELSINGWREASTETLVETGTKAPGLTNIDLGWCRGVDDFVIKGLLDGCERLKEIKCYGCNRVTVNCPQKSNVKIFGVESHTIA